jgi:hypothetical protein
MRSKSSDFPACSVAGSRAQRIGDRFVLSIAALALAAGCGAVDAPPVSEELHEVTGTVAVWPGEAQSSCGDRIAIQRFKDDVGTRALSETRVLLTSAQAYQDYFGHAAPAGVDLGREWVVFYSPGSNRGGYTPDVSVVGASNDVLHVVTTLTAPIPPCVPPIAPGMDIGGSSGSGSTGSGTATTGGGTGGSSGSAAAPTMPNSSAPATNAPGVAAPAYPIPGPAPAPLPPPPDMRPYVQSVLVKFLAQKTHSVEFQHQDINPGCGGVTPPPPSACAATLCPAGTTCIELETYPPQAKCVPVKGGSNCLTSGDCGAGLICSTEVGICAPNPTCAPNAVCDAACRGTCIMKPEPQPTRCTDSTTCGKGSHCSTERGDCQSCGSAPGTACPPVCFGVCEPDAAGVCTGGLLEGKGCRSEAEWKAAAAAECAKLKLELVDFGVGNACFAGGFAAAKYSCCSSKPVPPTPPPAAVCKVDSDCQLTSSGCRQDPCTCRARSIHQIEPSCPMTAIACLVDPCGKQQAACVAGLCVMKAQP